MAVKSKKKDNKLILEIDNGDMTKMEEVVQAWNFKDEQSLLRFCISMLLETEEKGLWIKSEGAPVAIAPAKHSIRG